jgi:predicted ATPase
MLSCEDFPYLQKITIQDAYVIHNLNVPVFGGPRFKHLILTGRNGSGKTTILESIAAKIQFDVSSADKHPYQIRNLKSWLSGDITPDRELQYRKELSLLQAVDLSFAYPPKSSSEREANRTGTFPDLAGVLVAYFPASRKSEVKAVDTPTKDDDYVTSLAKPKGVANFANSFKQYLVNKKVAQALAQLDGKPDKARENVRFFGNFEQTLQKVFSDSALTLEFVSEEYEFYLQHSDGRRTTFNQLSAGFSAFLSILMDLLMRVDLLRRQHKNYSYDPCGFVIIDEPETHLHLEMQYQILPLLTSLFPNLQFIVATHSPAVTSSIRNATVFDLTTHEVMGDEAAGSSYSELMLTHFGVSNEYSDVADDIIGDINRIVAAAGPDKASARRELLSLLQDKGQYMSPGLRLEVEAQLVGLE